MVDHAVSVLTGIPVQTLNGLVNKDVNIKKEPEIRDVTFTFYSGDRVNSSEDTSVSRFFIRNKPAKKYVGFRIDKFIFPNSLYNIYSGKRNKIYWTRSGSFSITIPDGEYSATTLKTTVDALMTAADANAYSLNIDTTTGLTTISGSAAFALDFTASDSIAVELGFAAATTSSATSHTGTKKAQLNKPSIMYMYIDGIGGAINAVLNTSVKYYTAVFKLDTSFGEYISVDPASQEYDNKLGLLVHTHKDFPTDIQFRFYDEEHNQLGFVGVDWLLQISFKSVM